MMQLMRFTTKRRERNAPNGGLSSVFVDHLPTNRKSPVRPLYLMLAQTILQFDHVIAVPAVAVRHVVAFMGRDSVIGWLLA
jgi:hypothetical protein